MLRYRKEEKNRTPANARTAQLSVVVGREHRCHCGTIHAGAMEVARLNKINDTVPYYLTMASAPIMLFKQFTNVLQLMNASKWLAEGDREERKRARAHRKM